MNELENNNKSLNKRLVNDFIAGSISGCASIISGHPIDTIKVRYQTSVQYKNIMDCVKCILRNEGLFSLFRGIIPPLITSSVLGASVFATYGYSLNILRQYKSNIEYKDIFLSGLISGIPAAIILCPTELIKIRQQISSKNRLSVLDCVRLSIQQSGTLGIFKGFWSTFYREVPAFGVYFVSYEFMKINFKKYTNINDFSLSIICGAFAGILSWCVIYPIDVIKTNIQVSTSPTSMSIIPMGIYLKNTYGWRYLYRGLDSTIIRAIPVNAVVFPSYNITIQLLEAYNF